LISQIFSLLFYFSWRDQVNSKWYLEYRCFA